MYRRLYKYFATLALLPLLGAGLTGCSTVQSRAASASHAPDEGMSYHLPRGQFNLHIVQASGGSVTVSLQGAKLLADHASPMVSRLPRNGSSDDNVTIVTDSDDLLSKVEVTSTGRLTQAAAALARTIGSFQGAADVQGETVFQRDFYLEELAGVVDAANAALRRHYVNRCTTGLTVGSLPFADQLREAGQSLDVEQTALRTRLLMCRSLVEAGLNENPDTRLIAIEVDAGAQDELSRPLATDYRDCARGVCYRPQMPVRITLSVGSHFSSAETFMVPNRSRLMHVDLAAGLFAEQKYSLTFSHGVLTSYTQNAQSELVGLFQLPAEVLKAFLSAPAEALGLRQANVTAETSYLNAVRSNVDAQRQAAETCAANRNACPDSATRLIRVQITPPQPSGSGNPVSTGVPGTGNSGGNDKVPGGGG